MVQGECVLSANVLWENIKGLSCFREDSTRFIHLASLRQ